MTLFQQEKLKNLWNKKFSPTSSSFSQKISSFYDEKGHSLYFGEGKKVENFSFSPSKNPVFWDEKNTPFFGLLSQQLKIVHKKPVYLVDNHQNALWGFFDFFVALGKKISVVHIDAHRDDAVFSAPFSEKNFSIENLISSCLVCDYLDAGKKMGIIDEIFSVTQSFEFQNFSLPKTPFVLNLDLDIFGEEGSAVELSEKIRVIAECWNHAEIVVCATSPGFLDSQTAEKIFEIFISE